MQGKSNLIYFVFIVTLFLTSSSFSQYNEFHPEYNWLTLKGKNVFVHYHEEAERTARTVLKIADEVWGPLTSLYQYEPDPVHYVIKDIDDYSNGATYFFDNKIEIWSSSLDFDLRGTHNWLRNVISHEFTHMVQIQASMKATRSLPAVYLQFLNYEDRRRPDVLYGFPNVIVSYPLATINIPAWFAEGTAQYMRKEFNYDNWDSHRDMILRSYVLDGNMLTWNQMGVFSKTSLGNESVYNSGFALTKYISQQYGEENLRKISQQLGSAGNFTIDAAFEDVLGKDGNEIYDEWMNHLKADYSTRTENVRSNIVEGKIIRDTGFGNFYPNFNYDGTAISYVSNKNADYFSMSGLYLYDITSGEETLIEKPVRSSQSFVKNGKKIVYSKLSSDNPDWTNIHDIYQYDIESETEKRLTNGLRANNPSVSNDGSKIVFIYQNDGTSNVGIIDSTGGNFKRLTFFENGEQVFNPKFGSNDSEIYFGYSSHEGRDIAKVKTDGSGMEFILNSEWDERNPFLTSDGKMYFSSDETGIFNIYTLDLKTGEKKQITNVIGGAFMPSVNSKGDIAYAGYTSSGYKIYLLPAGEQMAVSQENQYISISNPPLGNDIPNGDINNFNSDGLRNFDDNNLTGDPGERYSGFFTKLTFLPFIRFDNYNISNDGLDKIKPGLYIASNDMLNRYSLFAGGAINKRFERDLFFIFEYRNKVPLLYALGLKPELAIEVYSVSRETDVDIMFGIDSTGGNVTADYTVPTDVSYNLFEFDFVARHKLFSEATNLEFRFIFSKYSASLGSFLLPDDNNTLYPSTSDDYFIGRNFQLKLTHNAIIPTVDTDINPLGRKVELQYNYETDKFNPNGEYEVEDGVLLPVYKNYNFHRVELNWKEYFRVFKEHTFTTQLRLASILGPAVPDFFDYYLGGLIGMKSYPFYSIGGNELAWLNFTYRFPLFKNIDSRIGHIYIDKLYFSVFSDIGNAWTGDIPEIDNFKKGAGAEIRLKMISFYLFPTSLFLNAAYSFDSFSREIRGEMVNYGKEWRFYGGILFDFSF